MYMEFGCQFSYNNLAPGISWTEVAVAIALKHGMWFPVRRQDSHGAW